MQVEPSGKEKKKVHLKAVVPGASKPAVSVMFISPNSSASETLYCNLV